MIQFALGSVRGGEAGGNYDGDDGVLAGALTLSEFMINTPLAPTTAAIFYIQSTCTFIKIIGYRELFCLQFTLTIYVKILNSLVKIIFPP